MNSAPASILETNPLGRQPAGGSTGSSAAPSTNFTAPLISVPEGSRCSERIRCAVASKAVVSRSKTGFASGWSPSFGSRSEEHTSELQSRLHLVCRLLLEKKKNNEHDNRITCALTLRSK